AKVRANQQGLPVLVVIVDSVTCSQCKSFDYNILQQPSWQSFISEYPMFLVMLDRAKLTSSDWTTQTAAYRTGTSLSFPTIAVHAPNGTKLKQFVATGGNGTNPGFYNLVRPVIEPYYDTDPGTIGFTAAAQTVSEDGGAVTVTVSRQGGKAGAQTFTYATADGTATAGTDYDAVSGTLAWGNGDTASKSFAVPLKSDDRWTAPTQRVFTVTLALASGNAGLGTTTQTVTIEEAEPLAPGTLGFLTADGGHFREGEVYTGLVARTHGALGAVEVTLSAPAGYTVDPAVLQWADSNSDDKPFTLTGPAVTPEYDTRDVAVSLSGPAGGAVLGLAAQTVTALDQLVSETFEEYTAGRPLYEHLAQEDDDGFWFFYNEDIDALRTEPLNGGAQAVLIWTAPAAGRLTFTWGHNSTTINTPYTNIPFTGTCLFEAGGQSLELTAAETNNTVGVNAGDVIRWTATGQVSNYV
ncbi:MAG: Calx-beta domain-containing protein, partial [Kiritimatiellae bacterium]|nr:Calx-beta domain-containing protein [Kiritimatiellia bacterium]